MCPSFRSFVAILCVLVAALSILMLQGCTVNVVYMDGVNMDSSQNPYNYIEAPLATDPMYDCDFAPAADECQ
ncbi:hypothetical protein FDH02_gp38 [Pseudomonas phage VSW-3]|uniref:Lipoprotein n=1 Tax=Pseudomonas phage VSW-3 TaxID=1852562 RepID=A0A173GCN2_9CAUD|nr:hypothetical protein FDH02_gp38 [Pseudomonas phage VSW-3]ANH51114.1 hypothetical protein VSW3_38 [Pseudomonas phage VSW-3]